MNINESKEIPDNYPSLCIPRVTTEINEEMVKTIFNKLELGIISKIQIIRTKNKKDKVSIVYIHFKSWNKEGNGKIARERLLDNKDIKVIYDCPWYWKVYAYRLKK
jgi:hypothetical protein